ncbi:hypothetical protein SAMN05192541_101364 [Bradyrhizobium arachidis]|nr:hypothetical protein SAMN05192541_101364 [Bradyrhizobium arachidis]
MLAWHSAQAARHIASCVLVSQPGLNAARRDQLLGKMRIERASQQHHTILKPCASERLGVRFCRKRSRFVRTSRFHAHAMSANFGGHAPNCHHPSRPLDVLTSETTLTPRRSSLGGRKLPFIQPMMIGDVSGSSKRSFDARCLWLAVSHARTLMRERSPRRDHNSRHPRISIIGLYCFGARRADLRMDTSSRGR